MVTLTDAKVAEVLFSILNIPTDRYVYGAYFVAKNYWIRYNIEHPGIEMLPYVCFFRNFRFSEINKKAGDLEIIDFDDKAKVASFMPVTLAYIVELVTANVYEANLLVKRWMMWCGKIGTISFRDEGGIEWKFRVIPEDPEDNSDLDQEDDLGRVIRTTLNFQVESVFVDKGDDIALPVLEILSHIHLYYNGDITQSTNIIDGSNT